MDFKSCKRCGVKISPFENYEFTSRSKITYVNGKEKADYDSLYLCFYCTRALDNFLNCNWRFDHG